MRELFLYSMFALAFLMVLLGVGASSVTAQGPVNDDWTRALYMYNRPYAIPPSVFLWFKFDFTGDRTKLIEIILPGGYEKDLEFRVFTPENVVRFWEEDYVGRGNSNLVPCETGRCRSPDLLWKGTFNTAGTYYVEVRNHKQVAVPFRIFIFGEGVSLGDEPPPLEVLVLPTPATVAALPTPTSTRPPIATSPVITGTAPSTGLATLTPILPVPATRVPTGLVTAVIGPQNTSPYDAIYIPDNRPQSIDAKGELWYKFGYTGDRSRITITLLNGNAWGFEFKVYTPEHAFDVYTTDRFVGRGNAVNQPCDTGRCTADDLTWIGAFNTAGTYFVRVVNTKALQQAFILQIAGRSIDIIGP